MSSPTPQQVMESLIPIQQMLEKIVSVRPIMLKTADGWEIYSPTDLVTQAVEWRDAVWKRMFEAIGDHFEV